MIFEIPIDKDVIEKFEIALKLNEEEKREVIETFMLQYISNSFSKASQTYKPTPTLKTTGANDVINADTGKANIRIPKWAMKSEQINHKIVRAFFQVENELGYVPLEQLEKRCSEADDYPSTFVRDFRGNFNQMKIDAPKSHGKVFEVEKGNVVIWDYVKGILLEHKEYFCR